ncbi:hypothetical protein Ancab_031927 [Ancistrocladus abbreviatus]
MNTQRVVIVFDKFFSSSLSPCLPFSHSPLLSTLISQLCFTSALYSLKHSVPFHSNSHLFFPPFSNMKGINISCASQASTAICSSMEHTSSTSSSSASASSSSSAASHQFLTGGGRAIDRHNPIIRDARRAISRSTTLPSTSSPACQTTSKPPQPSKGRKKNNVKKLMIELSSSSSSKKSIINKNNNDKINNAKAQALKHQHDDHDQIINNSSSRSKSVSKPSDLILKGCTARPGVDYISPPESSRYLLDDPDFLDGLGGVDPVLSLVPYESKKAEVERVDAAKAPKQPPAASSPQVVVLRVSLHCKGCEGKVRKHISRMEGVTSFNIDFAAKKVTVVGDITPLGVLASISKVKNAQLWTPVVSTSSAPSVVSTNTVEALK